MRIPRIHVFLDEMVLDFDSEAGPSWDVDHAVGHLEGGSEQVERP
jgi:hypothetical protein